MAGGLFSWLHWAMFRNNPQTEQVICVYVHKRKALMDLTGFLPSTHGLIQFQPRSRTAT